MDAKELGLLAGQVDLENKSIEDVAQAWVDANETRWRAWVSATN
jgi:ABC-type proline/glycine betaine transport system substrate-binding protein